MRAYTHGHAHIHTDTDTRTHTHTDVNSEALLGNISSWLFLQGVVMGSKSRTYSQWE